MWTFELPNIKPLSQVEMLTLAITPSDDYTRAADLVKLIDEKMGSHYDAQRGTLYPILHRLSARGLLELDSDGKSKKVIRTDKGNDLILSISNSLINKLRSSFLYMNIVLDQIIELDSFEAIDLIEHFITELDLFKSMLDEKYSQAKADEKDWSDIPVNFGSE